jgi:hypothetical protein
MQTGPSNSITEYYLVVLVGPRIIQLVILGRYRAVSVYRLERGLLVLLL